MLVIMNAVLRHTAIGITGWGSAIPNSSFDKGYDPETACAPKHRPTVFTRVTSAKDWIKEITVGDAVFDSKCKRINGELPTLHSVISVIY